MDTVGVAPPVAKLRPRVRSSGVTQPSLNTHILFPSKPRK